MRFPSRPYSWSESRQLSNSGNLRLGRSDCAINLWSNHLPRVEDDREIDKCDERRNERDVGDPQLVRRRGRNCGARLSARDDGRERASWSSVRVCGGWTPVIAAARVRRATRFLPIRAGMSGATPRWRASSRRSRPKGPAAGVPDTRRGEGRRVRSHREVLRRPPGHSTIGYLSPVEFERQARVA